MHSGGQLLVVVPYFTSDIQGLLPGNYFLTVTDLVLGCSESDPLLLFYHTSVCSI